ncbi:MAG TPA: DUF268 domain-containing protein [Ignavibacteria bacterium]|nr:DUF268 domain-containing protein [Ignavibacteria bacterium]
MKKFLKKIRIYKILRAYYGALLGTFRNKVSLIKRITLFLKYFQDFKKYKKINENDKFKIDWDYLSPYIYDKTTNTPIGPVYFYQDAWCARKIFENKPYHHYDIGSKAEMIGIISQFIPTTMIDIRPIDLEIDGLNFIKGDILSLPLKDNSVESVSSICVIEHIGLGRYGDKIDPYGSEKAIEELKRVLSPNGSLYISVPIDSKNKVYFNAHRSFTRNLLLDLFKPLQLIEEEYIYGRRIYSNYNENESGVGMFYLKKKFNDNY